MSGLFQDIVSDLNKRRDELLAELGKIDQMISIATGESEEVSKQIQSDNKYAPKSGTPWTHHIRQIIIKENKPMTRLDLERELIRRGYADRETVEGAYNTIIGIISRLMKNEELTRDEETSVLSPGRKYTEKDDNSLLS